MAPEFADPNLVSAGESMIGGAAFTDGHGGLSERLVGEDNGEIGLAFGEEGCARSKLIETLVPASRRES